MTAAYNYFPSNDRLPIRLLKFKTKQVQLKALRSSQSYFAWQIYTVHTAHHAAVNGAGKTSSVLVPALVMVFAITSFAGGIGCASIMFIDNTQILMVRSYRFAVTAGIAKGSSAVADIIATIALCYQLSTSRTGIKQTDSLLKTLMQYIVQRGVLVTMIQTLFLVIFFSTASHAWWLALHVNVTRLYANTFFAMLNGRQNLRNKRASTNFMSASDSGGTYQGGNYTYPSGVKFPTASDGTHVNEKGINVDKTVMISDMSMSGETTRLLESDDAIGSAGVIVRRLIPSNYTGDSTGPQDAQEGKIPANLVSVVGTILFDRPKPLYGKMSNIFGRKQCLIFAYSVFALGSLCCGIAQNLQQLIAGRALAGIGGGGMSTVFLIQVPATLIAIASASLALNVPSQESTDLKAKLKRVDFAGSAALILCIFSLLVGLDRGGNGSWFDPLTIYVLVAFAVLFTVFAVVEEHVAIEPFAPRHIICGPSLIASYLVNFFSVAAGTTTMFHAPLYFQAVRELKASEAGVLLIPSILSGVAGSLVAGLLMQNTGKYYFITIVAYAITVFGAITTLLMTGVMEQSNWGVSLGIAVYGLGNGKST
ncbi:hypothetical protein DXG01_013025 [Tephrocybe rancida]|nr:hypothetical protein DXG01_013025 [Tephrocybe rancida]